MGQTYNCEGLGFSQVAGAARVLRKTADATMEAARLVTDGGALTTIRATRMEATRRVEQRHHCEGMCFM